MKLPSVFHVSVSEYILSRSDRIKPISAVYRLSTFTCLNFCKASARSSRIIPQGTGNQLTACSRNFFKDKLFGLFVSASLSNVRSLTFGATDLINCVLYVCDSRCSRRNVGVTCFGCCGKSVSVSSDGLVVKVVFWINTLKVFVLVEWAVCRVAY